MKSVKTAVQNRIDTTQLFLPGEPGRGEVARQKLLAAALELFGERGLEGASVRDIARAAGQNVAAIAYYFGGKEQLYQALLRGILRLMHGRLADVYGEIEAFRRQKRPAPPEAGRLLREFLKNVYLRLLSQNEAVPIGRLLVREQLNPTPGFEILYDTGFGPLHEALCFLLGVWLGRDPAEKEIIVRTHALMGQVYFFMMTREAILRRLRWRTLEGPNSQWVAGILAEQIDLLLSGLAQKLNSPLRS